MPVARPVPTKATAVRPPVNAANTFSFTSRDAVSRDIRDLLEFGEL